MDPGGAPQRRPRSPDAPRIAEIVPARAVLTELARGFLMVQAGDPERAKQFATSFLREQVGRTSDSRIVPVNRRPMVRRGVASVRGGGYAFTSTFDDESSGPEL